MFLIAAMVLLLIGHFIILASISVVTPLLVMMVLYHFLLSHDIEHYHYYDFCLVFVILGPFLS